MRSRPKFNSFVIRGFWAYLFLTQGKKTVIYRKDLEKGAKPSLVCAA
jgi:hypothetical protein